MTRYVLLVMPAVGGLVFTVLTEEGFHSVYDLEALYVGIVGSLGRFLRSLTDLVMSDQTVRGGEGLVAHCTREDRSWEY